MKREKYFNRTLTSGLKQNLKSFKAEYRSRKSKHSQRIIKCLLMNKRKASQLSFKIQKLAKKLKLTLILFQMKNSKSFKGMLKSA